MDDVYVLAWLRGLPDGELAAIRRRAHLARADVAGSVGVHHSTVYRWERGLRTPRGAVALRYARLLQALESQRERVVV